jgi:hypothetical protein
MTPYEQASKDMKKEPNKHDDLHWQREMIGLIRIHLPKMLPLAGYWTKYLIPIYGPHRPHSLTPEDFIEVMFMNAENITAEFQKLIEKES